MKKKLFLSSPVGYSYLLTMLIVLVFVIFGVLSLSASLRDYDYSQRIARRTTAYYEADTKALDILAEIDAVFASEDTLEKALALVSEFSGVTVGTDAEGGNIISYEVKMNDYQSLQVQLTAEEELSGKPVYKIARWKEVSTDYGEEETFLRVVGSK